MKVSIVNKSKHPLPEYATKMSAGIDIRASIDSPITVKPMQRISIPTGLHIQLPQGFEAQIRPRSGLAVQYGITVLNAPGTIDADYTGEVKVILINLGQEDFIINDGERIAQMIIAKYKQVQWVEVQGLQKTERGSGGFGHSGRK